MTGAVIESEFSVFIHTRPGPSTSGTVDATEAEIAGLYRELERILTLQTTRRDDRGLEAKRMSTMARLRRVQEAEAKRFRRLTESALEMKPGEGRAVLEKVERFLAKHADPTGTDSSSEEPVPPSA